jgi:putative intracellular protease/amidase
MESQIVYLYVFDTLSDWEPSFAISGINNPEFQLVPGHFIVKTVATDKRTVKTIGGLTIVPDITLSEIGIDESAMLILPGGSGWESGQHQEAIDKAKQFLESDKPIAAICGATLGLALAGLLDNVRHTSNAAVYLQATNYRGGKYYQEEPAFSDENIITASATAPIEFAYHIFKRLKVYSEKTLEAWYGLYKTGELRYFLALQDSGT